ncbi:unnamed protein product, partial [Staurois parvus]
GRPGYRNAGPRGDRDIVKLQGPGEEPGYSELQGPGETGYSGFRARGGRIIVQWQGPGRADISECRVRGERI